MYCRLSIALKWYRKRYHPRVQFFGTREMHASSLRQPQGRDIFAACGQLKRTVKG
jgi:adenine C2-methylase RlmN of 23S rRNA A2503 and tRNA A37